MDTLSKTAVLTITLNLFILLCLFGTYHSRDHFFKLTCLLIHKFYVSKDLVLLLFPQCLDHSK